MHKPFFTFLRSISLIFIFAAMVVTGCKSRTNSGLSMADDPENDSKGWSKAFLRKNLSDCIAKTGSKLSASEAYIYCECMMDKVQEKYPDESDAVNKATREELAVIEISCLTDQNNLQQWSVEDRSEFLSSCSLKMNESLGEAKAKNYCECMLGKIMKKSPDVNQSDNISRSLLNSWGDDCLK